MGALMELSGRSGRRLLLALLVAVALWMAAAAGRADAAISLVPSTVGGGLILTSNAGAQNIPYGGCINTGDRDDRQAFGCPGASIPTYCLPLPPFGCVPFADQIVLIAIPLGTPSGHWSFAGWTGCDFVSGNLCTISNPNAGTSFKSPRAFFNDSVGPTITSLSPTFSTSTDRGVSFSNAANESLSSISCRFDGAGAFTPCSAVKQLPEGTHTVQAQGVDLSGNLGFVSGTLSTVRIVDTQLVSGPADFSSVKRPTFTYSSLAGLRFECSIDSGAISTLCGDKNPSTNRASFTPPADLPDGLHTFRVEAIDGPDFDRVPIVRTWRVDTTAPVVSTFNSPTITDGVVTTALTAAFNFAATEVGGLARFECRLDSGAFQACTSGKSYSDLPFGERTFSVRGVDKAGNVGPTVSRTWTVAARDNDGDGFNQRSDCNDGSAAINPIAPDAPDNGVDENCDGADAVNLDRDADGFPRPADCNDGNPAIRPGIKDIPGNKVDENCDGSDAALPPITSTVTFNFPKPGAKFTKFTTFVVKGVPAGSKIVATCKGKPCGKKPPKQTVKKAKGNVKLKKFQRKFKPGSLIEVRITKPGMAGIVKQIRIVKKKNPVITTKCLSGSKVVKCA